MRSLSEQLRDVQKQIVEHVEQDCTGTLSKIQVNDLLREYDTLMNISVMNAAGENPLLHFVLMGTYQDKHLDLIEWEALSSNGCVDVLRNKPELADRIPKRVWGYMKANDYLQEILKYSPTLSEYIHPDDLVRMYGRDWALILMAQPSLEDFCTRAKGWQDLCPSDWYLLLRDSPQFGKYCKISDAGDLEFLKKEFGENFNKTPPQG